MTSIDVTDWHIERIAGFLEAIKGDHPSVEIECIARHHDTDRAGQMSMSLSDEPASDFIARRCGTCQTVTVSKIISLASLKGYKALGAVGETDDRPKPAHDHHSNGTEFH
jgi:hypothetical protein